MGATSGIHNITAIASDGRRARVFGVDFLIKVLYY